MIKIAICEANKEESQLLFSFIDQFYKQKELVFKIHCFQSGEELLSFSSKPYFDLIFLGIILKGINGIETASAIREFDPDCFIVFSTSSTEYAVESYQVEAFQYLLKPIDPQKLFQVLEKIQNKLKEKETQVIIVKLKDGYHVVPYQDIIYIESRNHQLIFHLKDKKEFSIYKKMDDLAILFHTEPRFIRTHKSYLINATYVKTAGNTSFTLLNGVEIPISRTYTDLAKKSYLDLMLSNKNQIWL